MLVLNVRHSYWRYPRIRSISLKRWAKKVWWGLVITIDLLALLFFLSLYFNMEQGYSVMYWLMDTSDSVLQRMGF